MLLSMFRAKHIFMAYSVMSAFSSASMLFIVDHNNPGWAVPVLVGLGRFGVVAMFTMVYLVHPGFFPTLFAVTSMGISNLAARIFVILAPLIAEVSYPVPVIVVTVLQIFAFVAAMLLIEPTSMKNKDKKGSAANSSSEKDRSKEE